MKELRTNYFPILICVIIFLYSKTLTGQELGLTAVDTVYTDSTFKITSKYYATDIHDFEIMSVTKIEVYYLSGKIKKTYFYNSDGEINGACLEFYENGQIRSISNYVNGKIVGDIFEYYPNGKLETKGHYKDIDFSNYIKKECDTLITKNDFGAIKRTIACRIKQEKDGVWTFYDESGKVINIERY